MKDKPITKYYPINLFLETKRCLVAGAGRVAERKVRRLLQCGAKVLVISPKITAGLKALASKKRIILKKRRVKLSDLNAAYLVISATDDRPLNSAIASYCRRKNILVNVVDSPKDCNFILPSVIKRGNLTITISTDGISPALAKRIRQDIQHMFGAEYTRLLRIIRKFRPKALEKIKKSKLRKEFFQKAIQTGILNLLKVNKVKQAKLKLEHLLQNAAI